MMLTNVGGESVLKCVFMESQQNKQQYCAVLIWQQQDDSIKFKYKSMEFQKKMFRQNDSQQLDQFEASQQANAGCQKWRRNKNVGLSVFIAKTFQILESDQYTDIITWNQLGTSFTIVDVEKFQAQILPIYFRHRNFSSFVRQLNMYDFHKIRNQKNFSMFEHKQFRRNSKESLYKIKRKGCVTRKQISVPAYRDDEDFSYNKKIALKDITLPQNMSNYKHIKNRYSRKEINSELLQSDLFIRDTKQNIGASINSRYSLKSRKAPTHKGTTEVSINNFDQNQNDSRQKICMPISSICNYNSPKNTQESNSKRELIQQFISSVPEILYSEHQIQQKIKELKENPKYKCLSSKDQLRRIYKKLKNRRAINYKQNQLEQLSIEQEIAVQNMNKGIKRQSQRHFQSVQDCEGFNISQAHMPMMALVPTEKFLPNRSISLIGSLAYLNHGQDFDTLMHGLGN